MRRIAVLDGSSNLIHMAASKPVSDLATLTVGKEPPVQFPMDQAKWVRFIAATEMLGQSHDIILAESVDLCMDTAIALATHRERDLRS